MTDLGLRFGIWVEPEAVNPGAQVLREHPDWVYRAGDRPLVTVRNQYVLDFGRPEVVQWACGWLRELLPDRRISYLKWDMNRPVSDGGRPGDPYGRQWSVQHVAGYYEVLAMLRREFDGVTVEACSGGGPLPLDRDRADARARGRPGGRAPDEPARIGASARFTWSLRLTARQDPGLPR